MLNLSINYKLSIKNSNRSTKLLYLFESAKAYDTQLEIINIKKMPIKVGLWFLFVIL